MRLLLAGALLFSFTCFGQITVTQSDFADGGDTVRMTAATDPQIDYSLTGTDIDWDYSYLTPEYQFVRDFKDISEGSALVQFQFGIFAPPKYQATNFAESDAIPLDDIGGFLPVNLSAVNLISKNDSDSISSVGYSIVVEGTEVPFRSELIESRYEFPLNYGDFYTGKGYSNLDMNPIYNGIWRQHRDRESHVDGWGTIKTPYGLFDAVRVRHTIQEEDSLFLDVNGFAFWVPLPIPDATIYEWWTNGELEPILRITVQDLLGQETVSGIEYRDIARPVANLDDIEAIELSVYPNPTTDVVHLKGAPIGTYYQVVNLNGQSVSEGVVSEDVTLIEASNLSSGTYLIVLGASQSVRTIEFVKQ